MMGAHWIENKDWYDWNIWMCSACREELMIEEGTPMDNQYRYCPFCGARMNEDADGKDVKKHCATCKWSDIKEGWMYCSKAQRPSPDEHILRGCEDWEAGTWREP